MEQVNHPSHYQSENGVETIDAIYAALGIKGLMDFCHGNAIKYLMRAKKKGSYIRDIEKAHWYLDYAVKELKKKEDNKVVDDHVYFQ